MTQSTYPSAHSEKFHISADHPALPGHFPGAPIVPGVMLLDRVVAAVERAWKLRVGGFAQAKFLHPLPPDTMVELIIERDSTGARFRIVDGARIVARGDIELAS